MKKEEEQKLYMNLIDNFQYIKKWLKKIFDQFKSEEENFKLPFLHRILFYIGQKENEKPLDVIIQEYQDVFSSDPTYMDKDEYDAVMAFLIVIQEVLLYRNNLKILFDMANKKQITYISRYLLEEENKIFTLCNLYEKYLVNNLRMEPIIDHIITDRHYDRVRGRS
jgi:hypothetical protein